MATPREIHSAASLTHARHDPALCLAPGLFRSTAKGKRGPLAITYAPSRGVTIEFGAPESPGADDLRDLQGLVGMAGTQRSIITEAAASPASKALRAGMALTGDACRHVTRIARGSYRELARELGYRNTENTKPIQNCIKRLANVSVEVICNGGSGGFRILSEFRDLSEKNGLCVALNPRITAAVRGKAPFTIIRLDEARLLGSDASRLIHQRLSGWIGAGETRLCTLDKLCSYVWPERTDSADTEKSRRRTTRKAMVEIAAAGWGVEENEQGTFKIARPAYKPKASSPGDGKHAAPPSATRSNQKMQAASRTTASRPGKIGPAISAHDARSQQGEAATGEAGLLVPIYQGTKQIIRGSKKKVGC